MNLTTLTARTAGFLSDPDQTRFSASYTGAVNDAQRQFSLDSNSLYKDLAYSTVAGTATRALPGDFVTEDTIVHAGLPLKPISRHTLYQLYGATDWTTLEGTPTHYMIDPNEDMLVIRLIPIPQDVQAVSMRYFALPAEVSAGADVVLNSSTLLIQYHLGIAAMAAFLILQSEAVTPEIQAKMGNLIKIYNDAVTKAIDKFGNTKSEPLRLRPKR